MGDAAVTALAVSRLSKTWLNKSRSGGLGGLVAQAGVRARARVRVRASRRDPGGRRA
jgi:hypothetical protein